MDNNNKLNIILFFNCQGKPIMKYLQQKLKANYMLECNYIHIDSGAKNLPLENFKKADIVVFQFVNKKHGICSTDPTSELNILKYLKKDCIRIGVPVCYQTAFWPILSHAGDSATGGEVIAELKKKHSLDEIINMYNNGDINFNLQERFDKDDKHTRDLELFYLNNVSLENYDVVEITPFIRENYKKYKLFFTHCHPSTYLYAYIANKIIDIINLKKNMEIVKHDIFKKSCGAGGCPCHGWWLHNSKYVKKELNITWMKELNDSEFVKRIK